MEYPREFPPESRAKVEAAKLRAARKFDSAKQNARWRSDVEVSFRIYVLIPFLVFANEACRLKLWPVDEIDSFCREFLRRHTIDAYTEKGKAAGLRDPISNWNGSILWEFEQDIEKTPQWQKYQDILLAVAESATLLPIPDRQPVRDGEKAVTVSTVVQTPPIDRLFSHSADYRSVSFRGTQLSFTPRQAQVIEMLHRAFMDGTPDIGKEFILEKLESPNSRLRDTFKGHEAWGSLIVPGSSRGTYRLNIGKTTARDSEQT